MKLSELVYQVVKNVKYYEDGGFSYDAFMSKEFDSDQDYANSINNAMSPINEAIHRLSDRNKIAYRITCCGFPKNGMVNISGFYDKVKKIKSVFFMWGTEYETVGFREFNKRYIFVERQYKAPVYVQYIEDIPHFYLNQIYETDTDYDLKDFGITDTMCDYIIEYAQGKLQEPIAPELANMHITRAEQYFSDLDEQQTGFTTKKVARKFRI